MAEAKAEDLGARLMRGVGSMYLLQILTVGLGIATNLVVGRFLPPAEYGLFSSAYFVVTLVAMLSNAGLATTLVRHPGDLSKRDYAAVFAWQAVVALALGALLYAAAPAIERFFEPGGAGSAEGGAVAGRMTSILRALAALPLIEALVTVPVVRMERELRYPRLAALGAIWAVFERAVLIALVVAGTGAFSYAVSRLAGAGLQAAMLLYLMRWQPLSLLGDVLRRGWHGDKFLRFGFALQAKSLPVAAVVGIIPGLGGRMFAASEVGLANWAHNLATAIGQPLPQSMGRVLLGASSRLKRDTAELRRVIEGALLACTALTGIPLAVLAATMPELLEHLFKPEWRGAAPYFALSAAVMFEGVLFVVLDALAVMLGLSRAVILANWAWGAASLVVCWIFARWLGPIGLTLGHVAATLVPVAMLARATSRDCPIALARRFLAPALVAFATGSAAYVFKGTVVTGVWTLLVFDGGMTLAGLLAQAALQPKFVAVVRERIAQRRRKAA